MAWSADDGNGCLAEPLNWRRMREPRFVDCVHSTVDGPAFRAFVMATEPEL